ncbi:CG30 [Trabala vishnou gigantina nucleopolyhedrovirus]|uniref:CG30 n=1 Tax=Trabala vishnou gigantina nucleopolyhedrovirus TaxID=2863583 RepID=UPI002481C3BC|nr:CG30 [Trabala vishnou gigantina nucleopolyhedrovirus]QYC92704.1 CG30 [Trabala vishnou gigantina nucleopolyhedrovirus]
METITLSCCVCLINSTIVCNRDIAEDCSTIVPMAKLLPCMHGVCLTCVHQLRTADGITCPMCRTEKIHMVRLYSISGSNVTIVNCRVTDVLIACKSIDNVNVKIFTECLFETSIINDNDDTKRDQQYMCTNVEKRVIDSQIIFNRQKIKSQNHILNINNDLIARSLEKITELSNSIDEIAKNNVKISRKCSKLLNIESKLTHQIYNNRKQLKTLVSQKKHLLNELSYARTTASRINRENFNLTKKNKILLIENDQLNRNVEKLKRYIKELNQFYKTQCDNTTDTAVVGDNKISSDNDNGDETNKINSSSNSSSSKSKNSL